MCVLAHPILHPDLPPSPARLCFFPVQCVCPMRFIFFPFQAARFPTAWGERETRTHAHAAAAAVCCTFFTVVLAHNHACFCVALLSSTASLCYGHFCASAYDWCASMLAETVAKRHKVSGAQFCLLPMTNLTGIR